MAKLASCQTARLRTQDWDSDFNALLNLLTSKGLTVLAQVASGQNVDRARQADQLLSSYQLAIQQQWQERWSGDGTSDKPPFIDTQGLRLLLETDRPEQYLRPAYFRVGRGTRSSMAEQDLGDWVEVDRAELAANELTVANESRVDLSRLVITTDAGVGKTTSPVVAHANPWGLQDILGNVWEWCEDWYYAVYDRNNVDEATDRVFRGGSWWSDAWYCRAAIRNRNEPANRNDNLRFRVAAAPIARGGYPVERNRPLPSPAHAGKISTRAAARVSSSMSNARARLFYSFLAVATMFSLHPIRPRDCKIGADERRECNR